MFAFKRADELYLYSPRYIDWALKESEVKYAPSIIRLNQTFVKRPLVGYKYEVEGKIFQKSFYELAKQNWDTIWCGVFVREHLGVPLGSGSGRAGGYYNFYILTGEAILDFDVSENAEISENGIEFKVIWKKIWGFKRPLWLAVAKFSAGDVGVISLDIGAFWDSPPTKVKYFETGVPAGTVFASKNYAGIKYVWNDSHWETLPDIYYTTFNTNADIWDENELNVGLIAPVDTIDN